MSQELAKLVYERVIFRCMLDISRYIIEMGESKPTNTNGDTTFWCVWKWGDLAPKYGPFNWKHDEHPGDFWPNCHEPRSFSTRVFRVQIGGETVKYQCFQFQRGLTHRAARVEKCNLILHWSILDMGMTPFLDRYLWKWCVWCVVCWVVRGCVAHFHYRGG